MTQYRQGDVLVRLIASADVNYGKLKKVDKDEGRVILAYGEVTGHAHAFAKEDRVALFMEEVDAIFNPSRFPGRISQPVAEQERDPTRVPQARRYLKVSETSLLKHDEHGEISIPPGDYEVIIQREYHPDAVRQVAD